MLVTAEVPGQTQEKYDQMIAILGPLIRQARGIVAHGAGPVSDGWRSFEVWETKEDATQFFAEYPPSEPAAWHHAKAHVVAAASVSCGPD